MNNMRKRRESVASVYRKTTKFLTSNTANLLKKMPNNRKYRLLAKVMEEYESADDFKPDKDCVTIDDDDDLGERDLDYYLGVRSKEIYWRDPVGKEQIRKDYLVYHCGISEDDYNQNYKTTNIKVSYPIQPRLKQVPFKIHKKGRRVNVRDESWCEKTGIFKIFANKRESESSDSYSECSNEDVRISDIANIDNDLQRDNVRNVLEHFNDFTIRDIMDDMNVEVGLKRWQSISFYFVKIQCFHKILLCNNNGNNLFKTVVLLSAGSSNKRSVRR